MFTRRRAIAAAADMVVDTRCAEDGALPAASWRKMALAAIEAGSTLQPRKGVSHAWIKGYIAAVWYASNGEVCAGAGLDDVTPFPVGQAAVDDPASVKPFAAKGPNWRDGNFGYLEKEFDATKKLTKAIKAELKAGRVLEVKKGSVYKIAKPK